jgi:hypothetical protein
VGLKALEASFSATIPDTRNVTIPVTSKFGNAPVTSPETPPGLVMSWMLDRLLSFLFMEFSRMKYFCA